jgi:hypothetical protein
MFGAMSLGEAQQGQAVAFKPRRINELYTSVVLARETRDKLKLLKRTLDFRAYDPLLNYMALEIAKGSLIPPASYEQVFDRLGTRPRIITGESGSGKSTLVRGLLSEWDGDVFALDTTGQDYPDLRRVDLAGPLRPRRHPLRPHLSLWVLPCGQGEEGGFVVSSGIRPPAILVPPPLRRSSGIRYINWLPFRARSRPMGRWRSDMTSYCQNRLLTSSAIHLTISILRVALHLTHILFSPSRMRHSWPSLAHTACLSRYSRTPMFCM